MRFNVKTWLKLLQTSRDRPERWVLRVDRDSLISEA